MPTYTMLPKHILITILTGLLLLCHLTLATAGEVQVSARVGQTDIYIGQPFALTLVIEGADEVSQPNLANFAGFDVKFLGQSQNSSIQIMNGHRESSKTIELRYQLTAQNKISAIPAITIVADGQSYKTNLVSLSTKQPKKNDHFKLEIQVSKPTAYVGEPLLMTTTWLIGQKARGGGFNLPILSDPRFTTSVRQDLLPKDNKQLIKIELGGEAILAKQYQKRVGGQDFMAITFFHTLIPKTTGNLTLPQGTIIVDALSGYETPRSRRNQFDIWGNSRQREIYKTIVIPADPVSLKVLPLPKQDIPQSFNGLVGQYSIKTSATPTTVNVGDPITLNLEISGPAANTITMPPLPLRQFKISNDPPKQSAGFDTITFTTTIRAKNEQVQEIPAIPLSFFNVDTGQYETTQTEPIPITVRATQIITASDALGGTGTISPTTPEPREEVHQGIHYNYSDIEAGAPTRNRIILWLGLLLPPLLFLIVVLLNRDVDTNDKAAKKRKQQALKQLKKELAGASAPGVITPGVGFFDAWLTFLGHELDRQPQTITAQDILSYLENQPTLASQIDTIFKTGEAIKYGGTKENLDPQRIIETASQLHKVLK